MIMINCDNNHEGIFPILALDGCGPLAHLSLDREESTDRANVDMARRIAARFEMKHFTHELKARIEQIILMIRGASNG
jgi:hypothetical protein